ncbi:MAG: S8 family serine peptidase [Aminivibrio sp.]
MRGKFGFLIVFICCMLLFSGTAFADTALPEIYSCDGAPVSGDYVEGEALVLLETPTAAVFAKGLALETALRSSGQAAAMSVGARAVRTYGAVASAAGKNIVHMKAEGKTTEQLLAALSGMPGVIGASPNYRVRISKTPNDPSYNKLWGMEKINAPAAWDKKTGSKAIVVAVVDTGIDYSHVDLADNVVTDFEGKQGFNAFEDDNNPMDRNGHGTHVAGIIGAKGNNDIGVAGVNWEVGLLGVKVLGDKGWGSDDGVIAGLNYVLEQKNKGLNIRVVNMSLGGWERPVLNPASDPYGNVIKAMSDAGIILVLAAGNEFQDLDNPGGPGSDKYNPANDYRGLLPYPASFRFANTITVASMDEDEGRSDFSNYSPNYVHLAAPGGGVFSTVPDKKYAFDSGTSMAAPHVAGAAALIASKHRDETATQIKARIIKNVTPNDKLKGKVATDGHLNVNAAIRAATPPDADPDGPVTGVSLPYASLNLVVGQTAVLQASVASEDAMNKSVIWRTSDKTIVDGTASGLAATIKALAAGSARISVKTREGGFEAACIVTVADSSGGCSVGGAATPLALLLAAPLVLLLRRR